MKKSLICIICLLMCLVSVEAQILFGTTSAGGKGGGGTINKFVLETNELTVVKSFESLVRILGTASRLIQASDGKFYGMTQSGGESNVGVIFSFDPLTKTYTKLWDFDQLNGASPEGSLLQAIDGNLYGTTSLGGINNRGVIFSFDLSSSTFKKLTDFGGINGEQPLGSLTQANDGKLYGLTLGGGTNNDGVIFAFDPSSSAFIKSKDFNGVEGAHPYVSLLQAADGKLYGTTHEGGSNGYGVVFSFDPMNSKYLKIHDFDNTNGRWPGVDRGSLVQAANGNLYGWTDRGGKNELGVLFSINPNSLKFTNEKDFSTTNPGSTFTLTNDGNLVGVADSILFSFDPLTSEYRILKNFGSNNNDSPGGPMVQAKNGYLYGTKSESGAGGRTAIFSLDLSDYRYSIMPQDLDVNQDGSNVTGSLVRANNGKLYGMTTSGGSKSYGTIFSFDPATSTFAKLSDFDKINGANPRGGLMQASDGKLYGMTATGGSNDRGVIFSFDPRDLTYTKVKDFTGPEGASPQGGLIQASDGKLYGMTAGGGVGQGVIFSFDFITGTYRNLKNFDTPFFDFNVGSAPYGNLIQANDGIMYGMTKSGGFEGDGTVFSFDPVTLKHDNFINFGNFESPGGSLIQANDGKLYGMDYGGGGNGDGEILSIDLPGLDQASFSFDPTTGIRPLGTLMQAKDGYLYGTTSEGGTHQKGIIFSFDISTGIITRRKDFDGENGAFPGVGSSFIEVSIDEINTPPVLTAIGDKSVNELEEFRFTAKATDKDSPANTLKFSLANAATGKFPEGATIDKSSGLFCWTPNEAQGPGTYRVKIVVSDGQCTDEEEIEITVCEINSKPVLATIGDQTVDENKVLTFTASAVDKDIPENTLKFSLADPSSGDFPTGASINASTGALNWLPSKTHVPGTFRIKVIVSDGTATDEEEFAIHVRKTSPASLTAYPNPSAQRTTVRFAVPTDESMVTLVVYDFKGQQINRLYEGRAEANRPYSFDLDGSTLSPGVYLIKLSMSQKAETFKIIITE